MNIWFPELCAFLNSKDSARGYGWHIGAGVRSQLFTEEQKDVLCEAVTRNLKSREQNGMLDYAGAYEIYWAFMNGIKDAQPQS